MTKFRKLTLFTMLIISIAAVICGGLFAFNNTGNNSNSKSNASKLETEEYSGPTGLLELGDKWDIDLVYIPDKDSMKDDNVQQVYEYSFSNSSSKNSLLLKLDSTPTMENMSISFVFSDTRISDHSTLVGGSYEDKMLEAGSKKYVYLIASVIDNSKTASYTDDIDWLFGKPLQLTYHTNIDGGQTATGYAVMGAPMKSLTAPVVEGYNFVGWYTDSSYSNAVTFPLTLSATRTLYAKYTIDWPENYLPTDWLAWDSTTSSYYVTKGTSTLPTELIIPSQYDDGINGKANVTYITEGTRTETETMAAHTGVFSDQAITSVTIPSTIITIGGYAFTRCTSLKSVSMVNGVASLGDCVFESCIGLTGVTIPNSVITLGNAVFQYCSGLTNIIMPNSITSMGVNTFYMCSNLTSVIFEENSQLTSIPHSTFDSCGFSNITLPNSITSIGEFAFEECINLTEIIIPSAVTIIGANAFDTCSALQYVTFGDNSQLTNIESQTFLDCIKLVSISIPNRVTTIGKQAFYNCTSLESVTFGDNSQLITIGTHAFRECSTLTSISIPNSVTTIGDYAFYQCGALKSVSFSNGLTTIGPAAFQNCIALTSISLPNSITTMGASVFNNCTSLETANIPTSLTTIPRYIFYCCDKLTSAMTIPSSVTSISERAFRSTGITSITFADTTYWYYTETEGATSGGTPVSVIDLSNSTTAATLLTADNSLYTYYWYKTDYGQNGNLPMDYIGYDSTKSTYYIKQGTSTLPANLVIPSKVDDGTNGEGSVTYIADSAFYGKTTITSVTFADNSQLTSIGANAFNGCSNLASITLPTSLTFIGDKAFASCGLTSIDITLNITSIGAYAFEYCTQLASVNFGDVSRVTSIGDYAFSGCNKLTSITIPNSVTKIGQWAFHNSGLTSATFNTLAVWYYTTNSNYTNGSAISVNGLTKTGTAAKYLTDNYVDYYWYLTKETFTLPTDWLEWDSSTSSYQVIKGTSALPTNVTIPSSYDDGTHGVAPVTKIVDGTGTMDENETLSAYGVFSNQTGLVSITIPYTITSIGDFSFSNCSALEDVTIQGVGVEGELQSQLTNIGQFAFCNCTKLTDISLPNSVSTMDIAAFYMCSSLVSANIPTSLTMLDTCLFASTAISSITIPNSITTMGDAVFQLCTNLTSITIPNSVQTIGTHQFWGAAKLSSVTFEAGCQLTILPEAAFYGCSALTRISIPSSITEFGKGVFEYSGLEEITIPSSVSIIRDRVFNNTSLTSIIIPSSVTSIGQRVFEGCTSLNEITFSDPTYWYYTETEGATSDGTQLIVDNPTTNATNFVGSYVSYYWYKSDVGNNGNIGMDWIGWDSTNSTYYIKKGTSALPAEVILPSVANDGSHGDSAPTYTVSYANGSGDGLFYGTGITSIYVPGTLTKLGTNTFYGCDKLTSVTLSEGITEMRSAVFENCTALKSIVLPSTLTTISSTGGQFKGCTSLTSVTNLPANLPAIYPGMFRNCSSLTSITIPDGVTSIGDAAFDGCSALTTVTINTTSKLTSIGTYAFQNCGKLTSITIPDGVTSIDYAAFYGCSALETASINTTSKLTSIGANAFQNCSKLTSITIPDGVTSIGGSAFNACSALTTVTINTTSKLTSIGTYAFNYCSNLTSISIPVSVTSLGKQVFYNCIESITFEDPTYWYYTSTEGDTTNGTQIPIADLSDTSTAATRLKTTYYGYYWYKSDYGVDGNLPIDWIGYDSAKSVYYIKKGTSALPSNVVIPTEAHDGTHGLAAVTYIADSAFADCTGITSLTISDTITSIGNYAFQDCTGIKNITIPDGITSIGNYAFDHCTNLATVTISTSSTLASIGNYAFYGCGKVTSIVIPSTTTKIGQWAFYQSGLKTATFKTLATWMATTNSGYTGGTALPAVKLSSASSAATYLVDDYVDYYWYRQAVVGNLPSDWLSWYAAQNCYQVIRGTSALPANLVIPETYNDGTHGEAMVRYILNSGDEANGVFYGQTVLTNVTLPSGMLHLGTSIFQGCTNLKTINLPDGLEYIGSGLFYGCASLTNIVIPSSVNYFSSSGAIFQGCTSLTSVTFNTTAITTIPTQCFYGCSKLTTVNIPTSVTSIGNSAFYGCSALLSISIPSGVTSIGNSAFNGCTALTGVEIPANVTSAGDNVFQNCTKLASVNFGAGSQLTTLGHSAFYGCSALTSIILPSSLTTLGTTGYTFYNCTSLKTVTFQNTCGVTQIVNCMFEGCAQLTAVNNIPSGITSIGDHAFANCYNLNSVTLPNAITSIGQEAFISCKSITTINIPAAVISVGDSAFQECAALATVTFAQGSKLTTISLGMFSNCEALTTINNLPSTIHTVRQSGFFNCKQLSMDISHLTFNSVGTYAFEYCSKVTGSANFSSTFNDLAHLAFYGTGITSVNFASDNTVFTAIPNRTFAECTSLKTVVLSPGITLIGYEAFSGCLNLVSINFPDGLIEIQYSAFNYCSSLTSITIPSSVTSIGDGAFSDCINLTSVTFKDTNFWWVSDTAGATSGGTMLYVPDISVASTAATYLKSTYCDKYWYKSEIGNDGNIDMSWIQYRSSKKDYGITRGDTSSLPTDIIIPTVANNGNGLGYVTYLTGGSTTDYTTGVFNSLTEITSVTIPDYMEGIQNYTFYGCTGLTTIKLGTTCRWFGKDVFAGCTNLSNLYIKDLTKWCEASFYSNTSTPFFQSGGGNLYMNNQLITDLVIPADSTQIAYIAFMNFTGLTSVSFESGSQCTEIVDHAFSGCKNLASITFPSTLTTIGGRAFNGCTALTSIEFPASLTSIHESAFNACSNITSLYIPSIEMWCNVTLRNGVAHPFNARAAGEGKLYVNGTLTTSITIPSTITSIGAYQFYKSNITSVTLPNTITSIDNYAFYYCSNLTSISIPASVTNIGDHAFYGCTSLTSVTFGDNSQLTSIGDSAFCFSVLTSVTIPSSVTSIGVYAFSGCSKLTSVTFEGLDMATWYQTSNSDYTNGTEITNDLSNTGTAATCLRSTYSGSYWYKEVLIPNLPSDWLAWDSTTSSYYVQKGTTALEADLIIPSTYNDGTHGTANVTYIASGTGSSTSVFYAQRSILKSVTLPNTLTSIGDYAFYYCSGLTSITIPSSVTSIGNYAFYMCDGLTSITIPSSVTSIGDYAFYYCSGLTSITIPSSVTSIGTSAFSDCYGLTSVTFGDNSQLTSIGNYAFSSNALTSITIPSSVTSIGNYAFQVCFALTSITFGDNSQLTSIGNRAFSSCSGLTSITFGDNSQLTSIGNRAFYGCSGLTSITIPSSVTSIGTYAFYGCSGLTSIAFEDNSQLTSIGDWAFSDCFGLTSITIPSSVTSIGCFAFDGCFGLMEGEGVTFEGLDGYAWYKTSNSDYTNGTKITNDLSNTSTAAICLISTYVDYYWYKE